MDLDLLRSVQSKFDKTQPLAVVRTASGGYHVFLKSDQFLSAKKQLKAFQGKKGAVDLLCGPCHVVAACSKIGTGQYQCAVNDPNWDDFHLVDKLTETSSLSEHEDFHLLFQNPPGSSSAAPPPPPTPVLNNTQSPEVQDSSRTTNRVHYRSLSTSTHLLLEEFWPFLLDSEGNLAYVPRDYHTGGGICTYEFIKIPNTGSWAHCPLDGQPGHTDHDVDNRHPAIKTKGPISATTTQARLVCLREKVTAGHGRTCTVLYKTEDGCTNERPSLPALETTEKFLAQLSTHKSWSREDVEDMNGCYFGIVNEFNGNGIVRRHQPNHISITLSDQLKKTLQMYQISGGVKKSRSITIHDLKMQPIWVQHGPPHFDATTNTWQSVWKEGERMMCTTTPCPSNPLEDDEALNHFLRLLQSVVGHDLERQEFICTFMAHIMQYPQNRPPFMLLLIGKQGTGKSLLMDCFQRALSVGPPCNVPRLKDFLDDNGFNAAFYTSNLVYVEEADRVNARSAKLFDRLKSIISQDTKIIKQKYHHDKMMPVTTRFVCTSNHRDCVLASEGMKRRLVVFENDKDADQEQYGDSFQFCSTKQNKPRIAAAVSGYLQKYNVPEMLTQEMAPPKPELQNLVELAHEFDDELVQDRQFHSRCHRRIQEEIERRCSQTSVRSSIR